MPELEGTAKEEAWGLLQSFNHLKFSFIFMYFVHLATVHVK